MKALQKLVPNASKTDKASMLEEVIKNATTYSNAFTSTNGMGSTAAMLNNMTANLPLAPYHSLTTAPLNYPTSSIPTLCPPFISPAFAMTSSIPNNDAISSIGTKSAAAPNIATTSFPFNHPYRAFLPQCDGAKDLTSDFMVKSAMKKSFDAFRKILRDQNLDAYFRDSCFGQYLDLPEDNNARFQMKMVLISKRDVIPSKWILYPYTPSKVKGAKRRRNFLFKVDVTVETTAEQHNIIVDNLSTTSKDEDLRQSKPNSIAPDDEQLVYIE
ncbi:hypothetical protein BC332_15909 [Capsicum chinense]|nr:hypothetical protein BC332_15909 [Capsicum chinense]